jgi:hypothetical protein
MGNALEDIGRIRKLVINWRLCGRYLRLKQKFKRQKKCLDRIGAVHAGEIRRLKESKKREIDRLEQIVLTQQTKIEIIQRESADRVMEALRLVGTGYALRETDEKIRDLRFEKFEEQKREENYPFSLRSSLSTDDQTEYDELFEAHKTRGLAEGYDEATIHRVWNQNEEKVLEDIHKPY